LRSGIFGLPCADRPIRNLEPLMSPTQLVVTEAKINQRCEAARRAGDLAEMQHCMAELTSLHRAYYGAPATGVLTSRSP
jgi:hypothetical protein